MTSGTQKLSVVEKVGYSLGDGAANFVFMTMILFQLNFYTDTMGIAAGIAGTLLLVGRFWDAFFDPMMGVLADRTNTRWGKFRPWVLWTALPWAIVMVLAYTVPGFSYGPTLVYAAVTNILLMTLYSANNTPYSAMTAVMTGDVNERTSLSAYRFVAALIAQLIVGGFTLPLVAKFGQGNNAKGWQMTIGLWALICVACFVITFLSTRERIQPLAQEKVSIRQSFGTLGKIGPWIAMFVVTLAHFTANSMRDGTVIYFFQYYVNKDRLFEFLGGAGLPYAADGASASGLWFSLLNAFGLVINATKSNVSSVGFSLWNMSAQFVLVIGVLFSTYLSIKFGKKVVALTGFALTTVFMAGFIFLPPDNIWAIFVMVWLRSLVYAPTIPLLWAMFADVADYSEWKTGRRTTGVIYATVLFALKLGLSLGGFLAGWLLSGYGYRAHVAQTDHALSGIRMTISIYPAILYCVIVGALCFYSITKKLNLEIQDELAERRKRFGGQAAIV
ncbi:MAG: MFS transporter [Terriglobia bacterium]|jgi:glycoside/pentoside/hexuronide:cation symporter, GPH family